MTDQTHETVNATEQPAVASGPLTLLTIDAKFPASEEPLTFEASIPQPARYMRAYVTQKGASSLHSAAGRPQLGHKVVRLVFLVSPGAEAVRAGFALVPQRTQVPFDAEHLLEVVIDTATGAPWALWNLPVRLGDAAQVEGEPS